MPKHASIPPRQSQVRETYRALHTASRASTQAASGARKPASPSDPYAILYRSDLPQDVCLDARQALKILRKNQRWPFAIACAHACAPPLSQTAPPPLPNGLELGPLLGRLCKATVQRRSLAFAAAAACIIRASDSLADREALLTVLAQAAPDVLASLPQWGHWLTLVTQAPHRATLLEALLQAANFAGHDREALLRLCEPLLLDFAEGDLPTMKRVIALFHTPVPTAKPGFSRAAAAAGIDPTRDDLAGDAALARAIDHNINELCLAEPGYNAHNRAHGELEGRIWQDAENVQRARRMSATRAAAGLVLRMAKLPTEPWVIAIVIERVLNKAAGLRAPAGNLNFVPGDAQAALDTWIRPQIDDDRIGPFAQNPRLDNLTDLNVGAMQLASCVWWLAQTHAPEHASAEEAARVRANLRHSFVRNVAECTESVLQLGGRRTRRRVCGNGVSQRLLQVLAGYLPYSLDALSPSMLLRLLSEEAFGRAGAATGPKEIVAFVEHAQAQAEAAFNTSRPNADARERRQAASDRQEFASQLQDYLAYDFDWAEPVREPTPQIKDVGADTSA